MPAMIANPFSIFIFFAQSTWLWLGSFHDRNNWKRMRGKFVLWGLEPTWLSLSIALVTRRQFVILRKHHCSSFLAFSTKLIYYGSVFFCLRYACSRYHTFSILLYLNVGFIHVKLVYFLVFSGAQEVDF